jgi:hypothetical protein
VGGWLPLNRERIKRTESVQNWERLTPELQPPPSNPTLFETPKKAQDIQALAEQLAVNCTPKTRIGVRKLGHAAVIGNTIAYTACQEVKLLRQRQKEHINRKNSQRLAKYADKIMWLPNDVREARKGKGRGRRRWQRRDGRLRLLLEVRSRALIEKDYGVPWFTPNEWAGVHKRKPW